MENPTLGWLKQIGTDGSDICRSVAVDHLGNVYISGYTTGNIEPGQREGGEEFGEPEVFLIKFDKQGVERWRRQIDRPGLLGAEGANAIATDHMGNIFVTGFTEGEGDGASHYSMVDGFLAKFDTQGTELWRKAINLSFVDRGNAIVTDHLGNVFISGETTVGSTGPEATKSLDAFLVKYDALGNERWVKKIGTKKEDRALGMAYDGNGYVYICGYTEGNLEKGKRKGRKDVFLAKFDAGSGTEIWRRQIGTADSEEANSIASDTKGNIYITGHTRGELEPGQQKGSRDIFLIKFNEEGAEQWHKQLGTGQNDIAYGITTDSEDKLYISGYTGGELEPGQKVKGRDIFLIKFDGEGEEYWRKQLGTDKGDTATGVVSDSYGNVYVTGNTGGAFGVEQELGNGDVFLAKYVDASSLNDHGLLVVPLHLKGIYVDQPMNTVGPTVDFSYLPWNDGQRDYNPDYAPLGEYLETKPLQSANGELQPGIHLHWTLPPALCRAVKANNGKDQYPIVPVKWNIVPIDSTQTTAKTLWSDYLHPEDTRANLKYAPVPVPHRPTKPPYRYMGKAINLGASPPDGAFYSGEDYLNKPMTCMGYGSLSFASFYPDSRGVFGHHEPLEGVKDLDSVTYFVRAELYKEGDDSMPLNQLMAATGLSLQEILKQFGWPLNEEGNLPEEIYLAGAVKINTAQSAKQAMSSSAQTLDFSLGNTGTEALSALLANHIAHNQAAAKKIEEQLEAILMQEKIQGQGADTGLKFLDARHDKGFRKLPGGSRWSLQPLSFGPDTRELFKMRFIKENERAKLEAEIKEEIAVLEEQKAEAETRLEQSEIQTQIDRKNRQIEWWNHLREACGRLIKLNIDQHTYEVEHRKLKSMQEQLFSDWYKYMLAKYPPPESLEVFEMAEWPDYGEIAAWLQKQALAIIEKQDSIGVLTIDKENQEMELAEGVSEDSIAKSLSNRFIGIKRVQERQAESAPNTKLIHQPAEPFYIPAEPVLLISGLNIPTPATRQSGPEVNHYLQADFLEGKTGAEKEKALFSELFPDAAEIPENDPWNPFILEWEAEFLPLVDTQANNAPQNRFTLEENKPDTELVVPENYKNVQPLTIRGRTFLTPGAKARKMSVLREFLELKLPRTATDAEGNDLDLTELDLTERVKSYIDSQQPYDTHNAILTAARAYQELDSMIVLSQALSGFNDALLQLSHYNQPPLYDPLGAESENIFSQMIGQLVGKQINGAPNPANPFLPVRAGSFRLTGIRLIDAWGRFRDLLNGTQTIEPILPQTLKPFSGKPGWAGLPLRLTQPLRLHFDWLATQPYNNQDVSLDQLLFASPILGWLVVNHLDRNLMYFDAQGNALGYYNRQAERALPPGLSSVPRTPSQVEHLLRHVDGNPDWMQAFLDATDEAFSHIAPNDNLLHSGVAMLTGKPMAVVRVRLQFELMGSPAQNHSWAALKEHIKQLKQGGTQPEEQWQKMKFPVRLGNYMKLNDGLIGFWVENEQGALQGPLYTMTNQTNRGDLLPHNKETLLWLPLDGQSVTLTLLIDPRATIHASSGILPVKSLKLRTELYTEAIGRLSSWFLNAPLLQPKGASSTLYATPPAESGYQWSWVEAANDHNQEGINPEWNDLSEFLAAEEKANLEKDSELKEGWLKLNHQ